MTVELPVNITMPLCENHRNEDRQRLPQNTQLWLRQVCQAIPLLQLST